MLQIALALQALAMFLSLKNLLVPINTKFHSNSCRQGGLMKYFVCVCVCVCGEGGGGGKEGRQVGNNLVMD